MPYGKGTYGSRVGRPAKKKLHRKEYQRLLDSSPKTGGTLDRAVQRVEDLKATARAGKKTDTKGKGRKWMLSSD